VEVALRAGECASMQWDHVTEDTIAIYPDGGGKTDSSSRLVPLDEVSRGYLPTSSRFDGGSVWSFTTEQLERTWYAAARKVNSLRPARLHDLRHDAASAFVEGGGSVTGSKALCGHGENSSINETVYQHARMTELRVGVQRARALRASRCALPAQVTTNYSKTQ
jgi:integrase